MVQSVRASQLRAFDLRGLEASSLELTGNWVRVVAGQHGERL